MIKYPEPKSFGPFQKFRERLREGGWARIIGLPFADERKYKRRKRQLGNLHGDTLYMQVNERVNLHGQTPEIAADLGSRKTKVPSRLGSKPVEFEVPAIDLRTGIVGIKDRRKNPERRGKGRNES